MTLDTLDIESLRRVFPRGASRDGFRLFLSRDPSGFTVAAVADGIRIELPGPWGSVREALDGFHAWKAARRDVSRVDG